MASIRFVFNFTAPFQGYIVGVAAPFSELLFSALDTNGFWTDTGVFFTDSRGRFSQPISFGENDGVIRELKLRDFNSSESSILTLDVLNGKLLNNKVLIE